MIARIQQLNKRTTGTPTTAPKSVSDSLFPSGYFEIPKWSPVVPPVGKVLAVSLPMATVQSVPKYGGNNKD